MLIHTHFRFFYIQKRCFSYINADVSESYHKLYYRHFRFPRPIDQIAKAFFSQEKESLTTFFGAVPMEEAKLPQWHWKVSVLIEILKRRF